MRNNLSSLGRVESFRLGFPVKCQNLIQTRPLVLRHISPDKQISALGICHRRNPCHQTNRSVSRCKLCTNSCIFFVFFFRTCSQPDSHIPETQAAELALSLLSGLVEKPFLQDDIQHGIKAHVRPSSVYSPAAKRGSIQPHTLMQLCTHWQRCSWTHMGTHTRNRKKKLSSHVVHRN